MSWRVVYDALSDAFEKKQNEESLDRIRKKLKRIFFGGLIPDVISPINKQKSLILIGFGWTRGRKKIKSHTWENKSNILKEKKKKGQLKLGWVCFFFSPSFLCPVDVDKRNEITFRIIWPRERRRRCSERGSERAGTRAASFEYEGPSLCVGGQTRRRNDGRH